MGTCCNCFRETQTAVCPHCGFDMTEDAGKYPQSLPYGTILAGKYITGRVLGQGGFAFTYKAYEPNRGRVVAVKEFFPDTMVHRDGGRAAVPYSDALGEDFDYGRSTFLQEARALAQFNDAPDIVSVYSYFEENNTAYLAMEYVSGESLQSYLGRMGGRISPESALAILKPVTNALSAAHAHGLIHRDVKPDNIMLTSDGGVKLIDFGSARYSLGEKSRSLDVVLTHGFSPYEQYSRHRRQGPFTDVYALAATFYYAVTGRKPPDAVDRMEEDGLILPSSLGVRLPRQREDALMKALEVRSENRFQTIAEFRDALWAEPAETRSFTVTWLNGNGELLGRSEGVPAGTVPVYEGAAPALPGDDRFTYRFAGWDPAVVPVSGDAVYTAAYVMTPVPPATKPKAESAAAAAGRPLPQANRGSVERAGKKPGRAELSKEEAERKAAKAAAAKKKKTIAVGAIGLVAVAAIALLLWKVISPRIGEAASTPTAAVLAEATPVQTATPEPTSTVTASGITGGLTWTLEADGTLTVGGSGELERIQELSDNADEIRSVVLERGITGIGESAFFSYRNLQSVSLPDSLKSIGSQAFKGCSSLTSVTIPDSLTSIGGNAFFRCCALTSIEIPDSVKSIGDFAFDSCSGLTSVTIGNGLTSIGKYAFYCCSSLKEIILPDSVTSLGNQAFHGCSGLTSIIIGNGVTSLGTAAFKGLKSLTSVMIGNGVTSIDSEAFQGCSNLASVMIGNGVTKIDNAAFAECSGLTNITVPEGVTYIGYAAFAGCSGLTSITIPAGVLKIDGTAFMSCNGLTDVFFGGTESAWNEINIRTNNSSLLNATIHFNSN